jgi:hypothetical protein
MKGKTKRKASKQQKACKSCDDLVKRTHVLLLNAWAGNEGPF